MRPRLRLAAHQFRHGEHVIEVWYGDRMLMQVTGADGPGVRVLSKYPLHAYEERHERATPVHVIEVVLK